MRISADRDRCEGHGQCEAQAPDVYTLDDDGVVVDLFDGADLPADAENAAKRGANVCPVAALAVVETEV